MPDMKRFDTSDEPECLKEKILDAADKRFRLYGFKKTAMAEIADDMGMSTANLYRYFPHKIDIADSFALRCFVEKEKALALIVNRRMLSAAERLSSFALELLRYNHQQLLEYPSINDIIVTLCEARPSLVERKRQGEASLLADIINIGIEQEGWQVADVELTSRAILASWVLFTTPTFLQTFTEKELTDLVNEMVNLLLNGLKERN